MSTLDDDLHEYRKGLSTKVPFLIPRFFTTEDKWTNGTLGGHRFFAWARESAPDLAVILKHDRLLIIGEPGAGKSTIGLAVIQAVLAKGEANDIPILVALKSYKGVLRELLLQAVSGREGILNASEINKTYIFDGFDEVPPELRDCLKKEVEILTAIQGTERIVLMARQAFRSQHPEVFPENMTSFLLLDFDEKDVRSFSKHHGVDDPDAFLVAVRKINCESEIRNPFVLSVMVDCYKEEGGHLSPLRSDNVKRVVERLIDRRRLINSNRQRRALRMLAIACETAARNELSSEEASRVLTESMVIKPESAVELLDELTHSILIKTRSGVSFQMRSFGEYLAAEELQDKSVQRVKELAFIDNVPVDSWLNTITYLAELNSQVKDYFVKNHPRWLVNVSPAAFNEMELTVLTKQIVVQANQVGTYLVHDDSFLLYDLDRLLTEETTRYLEECLLSENPFEIANAIVLLAIRKKPGITQRAVKLATEHRNSGMLRYSAIKALGELGDRSIIPNLIQFADPNDPYHLHILDAIGSCAQPADFQTVLPLLTKENAVLSLTCYHLRELKTKEALMAALEYITLNPESLRSNRLDALLGNIIDLIPEYFGFDVANACGLLLASLERAQSEKGNLLRKIVKHLKGSDQEGFAIRAMLGALSYHGVRLVYIDYVVAPLVTIEAAQWISDNASEYINDLISWLRGPVWELLVKQLPPPTKEQDAYIAQHKEEQRVSEEKYREIEEERTYAYTQHQLTISTAKDIGRIVNACAQLPQEHWPKISSDQRDWLASSVTESLSNLDLDDKIEQKEDDTWSEPNWLRPLLDIIDAYYIKVSDDLPLILALKAFSYGPINKYFCRETLSKSAENELTVLLNGTHQRIVHNVLMFLRTTKKMPVPVSNVLPKIALNCGYQWQLRAEAIDLLEGLAASTKTLDALSKDADSRIRDLALKKLVDQQHRPTICRRLAKLTDEELIQGNVEPPGYSPLDWIGRIKSEFAIKPLEDMRSRASKLALWSLVGSVAEVIARIDKPSAVRIIREQLLPDTPSNIRSHFEQRANHFERTARIEAAQQTSFDQIIEKLKGTTSMISIKVWCEGPSDVHIVEKLLRDLDQSEIARTIDNVGGWTNLMHKVPARMLDGCREAILIVDGDKGRNRSMAGRPYSKDAEKIKRRFAKHSLKLYVLERYGIEDYIPRHAYETVLGRDLSDYFPVPHDKNLKDHCKEVVPKGLPFNPKGHNEKVAQHISPKDFEGTDLMDILRDICNMAEVARR